MILEAIVTISVALTGNTCAAIDNAANAAAWGGPDVALTRTVYTDYGAIVYADVPAPTDTDSWVALHTAERELLAGPVGHRVAVACIG